MSNYRVLLTDYAWSDLEIERKILSEIGAELVVAENGNRDTLVRLAAGCDAIMTNWAKTTAEVIAAAEKCRIVARLGIGLDNIDVAYCTEHGIPVTNVPDYCVIEVAEHAIALLLTMSRKTAFYHHETKSGRYALQAGPPLRRLEGQTLGIVGFGNIGRRIAEKGIGLGLKIIAYNRTTKEAVPGVEFTSLNDVISRSDFLSLNIPAVPETRHLMNAERLAMMKRSAYLINTARGALIDQPALAAALAAGQLAGAALDVQDPEPPDLSQPPFNDERVIVTPHAAFVSEESLANLRSRTARQVVDVLLGRTPENVRNGVKIG